MIRKLTIKEMRQLAEKRGGRCLSSTYLNTNTKLLWECSKGHQWQAVPRHVKRGSWCPYCAGTMPGTIEEMRELARQHGGKCLSDTYMNVNIKLKWQCAEGHKPWEATPSDIKSDKWCPDCAGNRRGTIEEMQELARQHGGKCLSDTYVNAHKRLKWQCAEGHKPWEAIPDSIKRGTWCPECAGHIVTIDDMHRLAEERGGKCLSDRYVDAHTNLDWECAEGHKFNARSNNVQQGKWCPKCSSGLGERICREFFEQLFEAKFPKSRPRWLVNAAGNQMELDGYCRSLRLAFEHQGEQHYSLKTHYIKDRETLVRRQKDDSLKRALCHQHGIILILVPEIGRKTSIDDMVPLIKIECENAGMTIAPNFGTKTIDLRQAYVTCSSRKMMEELQSIAKIYGGRCISNEYVNNYIKLLWECAKGHQWQAPPSNIKQGHWCPECAGTMRSSIEEMCELARQRGGKCLSDIYVNAHTKLLWECAKGHQWSATSNNIKRGEWCAYCYGNINLTIEQMRQLAQERGGKCLSDAYVNADTKLLWECAKGHQWQATPYHIKNRNSWCPECAGTKRSTIEEMRELARQRGGKCLSDNYVSTHTKLLWECAEGHQWQAIPSNIKRGSWCPYCAGRGRKS
jgi:hypothetical protein